MKILKTNPITIESLYLSSDMISMNRTLNYKFNKKHRDSSKHKSQWKISKQEEIEIFLNSIRNNWFKGEFSDKKCILTSPDGIAWGIGLISDKCSVIGVSSDGTTELKACKFVESSPNYWHGYPANFKNRQDVPLDEILDSWRKLGFINKPLLLNIKKRRVCTI